ncbi:hypothetical protein AAG570_010597 [Ranatra chinensis]|uniref:Serpin domain-containing protein n=1 Tax=Ranatra chinensis TaxID=642074 RepID=A0ABD0YN10_9HEMI
MASKRRNMFQKNKTQETTENGLFALASCESPVVEPQEEANEIVAGQNKLAMDLFKYKLYCDYPLCLKAEDGAQAPKHVLPVQEAVNDGNSGAGKSRRIAIREDIVTVACRLLLLSSHILKDGTAEGNLFISPLSVATCLAMLYMMANTTTAQEIAAVMNVHQPDNIDEDNSLAEGFQRALKSLDVGGSFLIANRVFVDDEFEVKPSYTEAVKEYLGADSEILDFTNHTESSRKRINKWASDHTKGKIDQLLKPGALSMDIVMVLVSTIHFKGKWQHCFSNTTQMDFVSEGGNRTAVKMLKVFEKLGHAEIPSIGARVLSLPYLDNNQSLVIILPDEVDGLAKVEEEIVKLDFEKDILQQIKATSIVNAAIPEFQLEESYELRSPLSQLGMKSAFNGHVSDFSRGVSTTGLEVSKVYHNTAIVVNEEGTEAAASTGAGLYLKSGVVTDFTVDHPFMFAITDNKLKSIVFLGRFLGPDQ